MSILRRLQLSGLIFMVGLPILNRHIMGRVMCDMPERRSTKKGELMTKMSK